MRASRLNASAVIWSLVLAAASFSQLVSVDTACAQRGGRGGGGAGLIKARVTPKWFGDNTRFWYMNGLRDGAKEFILVDAVAGKRDRAFDHEKLAAALGKANSKEYRADRLPFEAIEIVDGGKVVQFNIENVKWKCDLATYDVAVVPGDKPDAKAGARDDAARGDAEEMKIASLDFEAQPIEASELDLDDDSLLSPQVQDAQRGGQRGRGQRGRGQGGGFGRGGGAAGPVKSPNEKWTAELRESNIFLKDADGKESQLTQDGREGFAYTRLSWSPNSDYLVGFRTEPGDHKEVYRVQSSPAGTGDAKGGGVGRAVLQTASYALPGDKFDSYELNVFNIDSKKQFKPLSEERIDMSPSGGDPNPGFGGQAASFRWKSDGIHFTLEKFDRGHQRVRVIEVDSRTGESRNIIDEKSKTFIWSAHIENIGVRLINYLRDENELMYVSEMDGWRHLYLANAKNAEMKQITKGSWLVRSVTDIDQDARQIWFTASGVYPDQDPYFIHYGRVNFDGTGLTWLTSGNGTHTITAAAEGSSYSPDRKYVIDSYSRIDMPPVTELRRVSDGQIVCALEKAEVTVPFDPPEVFVAKGRDGTTDIWGIITRPRNLDTTKKYAILEDIYAGPQSAFVPKAFATTSRYQDLTSLGFIVMKIDGMGTAHRSKAFHDVCWHNLKDAGFLDRIAWMKAAAKKYPYMDIDRVGVYGGSAGGQNAAAAVLFHPEFYKVAVANCGCHDNRMDKASWNEQWMGYPVDKHYGESSNIDNAHLLQGRLQLVVGELDSNVPPESTYRLVDALVKARKEFEFVLIPGANHGAGSPITRTKLQDFFVRHLQGIEPPNRNTQRAPAE